MIQQELAIQIPLNALADRDDSNRVPLAQRGGFDRRARELSSSSIVVVETEVVLQSIGANHVIPAVRKPKDDAAGGILSTRHRLEANRDVDIAVRAAWGDDDVERILE